MAEKFKKTGIVRDNDFLFTTFLAAFFLTTFLRF